MSTTNDAVRLALQKIIPQPLDNLVPGPASTQGTATPINMLSTRIELSVANGSLIMPSLLTQEAVTAPYWVMNDTAGAVVVYCAAGETMNGSSNASLSIPSGQTGVFIPVRNAAGTIDWRSSVIA